MIELGIYIGIVFLVGIILILIPTRAWNKVLHIFSFNKFGVRYIRRRRDNTDTLCNVFLFISFLLSISYWIIPYFQIVIGVWLTFAFIVTFAQGARVGMSLSTFKGKMVLLGIVLMYGCGLLSSVGVINQFALVSRATFFEKAVFSKEILDVFFYLQKPYAMDILLGFFVIFTSCYILWAQFKYLRLEDTFKARWIITYLLKVLFVCALVVGVSYFGFDFIDQVYEVSSAKV